MEQEIKHSTAIVVLTLWRSQYGLETLKELQSRGLQVDLVVALERSFKTKLKMLKSVAKRIGWGDALYYAAREVTGKSSYGSAKKQDSALKSVYQSLCKEFLRTGNLHSTEIINHVMRLKPKLMILAHSGIVRNDLLSIPKLTINAHPGPLPQIRGIDAIPWSIHEGLHPSVSVHIVDAGIDTGGILSVSKIDLEKKDSLESLEKKAQLLSYKLLGETAEKIINGDVKLTTQSSSDGKQYYKMPVKKLHKLQHELAKKIEIINQNNNTNSH